MFLLQQLPLVSVPLVQLRIAAAVEIHVCTPKYQVRSWCVPHGLSCTADLLTFRALGLAELACFKREGLSQVRLPSPTGEE